MTYDQLEPHYWYAEQMMGVSGKAGNLRGKLIDGGNIFESPRMQEYPTPPLKHSYASHLFEEATRKLGYHPYPTPAANLSENYTNPDGVSRVACAYCGYCSRFGCMIGAKSQPSNTLMPVLHKHKSFQLRTGSWVRRIVHENGRATGVQFTDANGEEFFQPAETVILASFTLNNNRLLFLSKIGTPYDPATGKGTLGRNLTHQVEGGIRVFFDKPLNAFMGAGSPGPAHFRFRRRQRTQRFGRVAAVRHAEFEQQWRLAHRFLRRPASWSIRNPIGARSGRPLRCSGTTAWRNSTYTANTCRIARTTSTWIPPTQISSAIHCCASLSIGPSTNTSSAISLMIWRPKSRRLWERNWTPTRPSRAKYNVINYQSTHIQGGAVMGASPETSVVNPYLQHWDMPNLWVIGASSFPQTASGNPTLTVLAVNHWSADALIDKYLKHPGRLI